MIQKIIRFFQFRKNKKIKEEINNYLNSCISLEEKAFGMSLCVYLSFRAKMNISSKNLKRYLWEKYSHNSNYSMHTLATPSLRKLYYKLKSWKKVRAHILEEFLWTQKL